jgi:hypothetical protein
LQFNNWKPARVGGFGTVLVFGFDCKHKLEAWRNSLTFLQQEVMPRPPLCAKTGNLECG